MSGAPTLILIDALALLYRSFYAIRELSTSQGVPTNALFGFVRKLKQLRAQWRPTQLVVVFDGGLPAERLALLETYKAQRPPMPEALRGQIPLAEEYLAAAGVMACRLQGQEADDVIASFTARALPGVEHVLIASGDKDMYQLVSERVSILPLAAKERDLLGPREVRAKTGVDPGQIVDWLALVGDAVDNVPGVPGVGPKTAARLLGEWGSLEGILGNLDRIASDSLRRKLSGQRELLERNLAMVRLNAGLDVPWDMGELMPGPPDTDRLIAFLDAMEFHALADELRAGDLLL